MYVTVTTQHCVMIQLLVGMQWDVAMTVSTTQKYPIVTQLKLSYDSNVAIWSSGPFFLYTSLFIQEYRSS